VRKEARQNAVGQAQDASQRATGREGEGSRSQGVEGSGGGGKALFRCDLGTGEREFYARDYIIIYSSQHGLNLA